MVHDTKSAQHAQNEEEHNIYIYIVTSWGQSNAPILLITIVGWF